MKGVGRPKTSNPRSYRVEVRLTDFEDLILRAIATEMGMSASEVLRTAIAFHRERLKSQIKPEIEKSECCVKLIAVRVQNPPRRTAQ